MSIEPVPVLAIRGARGTSLHLQWALLSIPGVRRVAVFGADRTAKLYVVVDGGDPLVLRETIEANRHAGVLPVLLHRK